MLTLAPRRLDVAVVSCAAAPDIIIMAAIVMKLIVCLNILDIGWRWRQWCWLSLVGGLDKESKKR